MIGRSPQPGGQPASRWADREADRAARTGAGWTEATLVLGEQRAQGSFAYTEPELGRAVGLLEGGLIDPGVSDRSFPHVESGAAFRRLLDSSAGGFPKAIVNAGGPA